MEKAKGRENAQKDKQACVFVQVCRSKLAGEASGEFAPTLNWSSRGMDGRLGPAARSYWTGVARESWREGLTRRGIWGEGRGVQRTVWWPVATGPSEPTSICETCPTQVPHTTVLLSLVCGTWIHMAGSDPTVVFVPFRPGGLACFLRTWIIVSRVLCDARPAAEGSGLISTDSTACHWGRELERWGRQVRLAMPFERTGQLVQLCRNSEHGWWYRPVPLLRLPLAFLVKYSDVRPLRL